MTGFMFLMVQVFQNTSVQSTFSIQGNAIVITQDIILMKPEVGM